MKFKKRRMRSSESERERESNREQINNECEV